MKSKWKPVGPLEIAQHEAAHAVMRKLVGLPATALFLHEKGGFCAGTGKIISPDANVLLSLAGPAWETLEGIGPPIEKINFNSASLSYRDIAEAWDSLQSCHSLRIIVQNENGGANVSVEPVSKSIRRWFKMAMDEIRPHRELIFRMGTRLHEKSELSPKQVRAMLRGVSTGLVGCPGDWVLTEVDFERAGIPSRTEQRPKN